MASRQKINNIQIVGYGLSLLYGTSFWVYLDTFRHPDFRFHAILLSLIFLILFLNSFAVVRCLEVSRKILVYLNAFMAIYFLGLTWTYSRYIQPGYIFVNTAVVLFFELKRIRVMFQKDWHTARKSVLVIDDDEGLQKTAKRILLSNGYSVLSATTGERGIQVARLQKPDLIILDVLLPGMKGREVCQTLKSDSQTRDIPVMFMTAKESPDDILAEKEAGGVAHLTKPVNTKSLISEVRKLLG